MMESDTRSHHRFTKENELLRRLQKLSGKLLKQTNKEALLQEILFHATQFLEAASGAVSLVDEDDRQWITIRYGLGTHVDRVGVRIRLTDGLVGEVWRTGQVQVVDDYRTWKNRINDPQLARMTTLMMAPLRVDGDMVGIIQLSWNDAIYPLSGEKLAAFESFATLASIAWENATLFQKAQLEIFERKQAEAELRREQAFSKAVLDSVPGMLYLYDAEGKLVRWNKQHEIMTGYNADEIRGMHILDWFRDASAKGAIVKEAAKAMQGQYAEARVDLQRKDGTELTMYFTAVGLNIDGNPYITGVGIDITRLKEAEDALREAKETLELKVEERTQELNALNEELTAMNEEMTMMNEALLHSNDRLQKEIEVRQEAELSLTGKLAQSD